MEYNNYMPRKILSTEGFTPEYIEYLKSKIEERYRVSKTGCWEWTRSKIPAGYGKMKAKKSTWGVHRLYYQLVNGPVDSSLVISHLCDNPPCINPSHLEATTQWENNARGSGVSAQNLRKTHCKHGHEYTSENTRVRISKNHPRRTCRTCDLAQDRERKRRYAIKARQERLT